MLTCLFSLPLGVFVCQGMRQQNDIGTTYRSTIYTYTKQQLDEALASKEQYQKVPCTTSPTIPCVHPPPHLCLSSPHHSLAGSQQPNADVSQMPLLVCMCVFMLPGYFPHVCQMHACTHRDTLPPVLITKAVHTLPLWNSPAETPAGTTIPSSGGGGCFHGNSRGGGSLSRSHSLTFSLSLCLGHGGNAEPPQPRWRLQTSRLFCPQMLM